MGDQKNLPFFWSGAKFLSSSEMCMCWLTRRKCRSLCVCFLHKDRGERNANGRRLEWCRLDCAGRKIVPHTLQANYCQTVWVRRLRSRALSLSLQHKRQNTTQLRREKIPNFGYMQTNIWVAKRIYKQTLIVLRKYIVLKPTAWRSNWLIAFVNGPGVFFLRSDDMVLVLASEQFPYLEARKYCPSPHMWRLELRTT